MSVTLTTNGVVIGNSWRMCLAECLQACVRRGPIAMWQHAMGWEAYNFLPEQAASIPRSAIAETYRVTRDPDCMFPETGVVYVLNQIPTLVSPPVCEWDQPDSPGGEG